MHRFVFQSLATLCFAIVLFAQGGVLHAEDDTNTSVGITISTVVNASPSVGERVSLALGDALRETLRAEILAGPKAQALLPEEARSGTCLGDSACLVSAGKALGVEQLLMLIIVGVGDELKIEATWVDVATGETALRPGITSTLDDAALQTAFRVHAKELLPGVPLRHVSTPATTDPVANTVPAVKEQTSSISVRKPKTASNRNSKILMVAGGALVLGSSGYFLYRYTKCDNSYTCDRLHPTRDTAADVTGVLGGLAFAAGLYLYLSHDDEEHPAPIAFSLDSDSFALSLGGSF